MRRWWCAAAGLGRRVLSPSTSAVASHARPQPLPLTLKSASFTVPFSLPCRRHHSLPGLFHPAIASSFRAPVSFRLVSSRPIWFESLSPWCWLPEWTVSCSRRIISRCGTTPSRRDRARRSRPPNPKSRNTRWRPPRNRPIRYPCALLTSSRQAPLAADSMLLLLGPWSLDSEPWKTDRSAGGGQASATMHTLRYIQTNL